MAINSTLLCFCCLGLSSVMQAQSDPAKIYKTNCVLCHSADGSGDSPTGKAFHSKDLRSADVQKQTDAELAAVITKGRGKLPAFGAKIKPGRCNEIGGLPPGTAEIKVCNLGFWRLLAASVVLRHLEMAWLKMRDIQQARLL